MPQIFTMKRLNQLETKLKQSKLLDLAKGYEIQAKLSVSSPVAANWYSNVAWCDRSSSLMRLLLIVKRMQRVRW